MVKGYSTQGEQDSVSDGHLGLESYLSNPGPIYAQGLLINSDLHGHETILRNGMQKAASNDLLYTFNGDWKNDYALPELAQKMGYVSPELLQASYVKNHLSESDLQTLAVVETVKQVGIERLFSQIDPNDYAQAEQEIKQAFTYYKSEKFQSKIQNIEKNMMTDIGSQIMESKLRYQVLEHVFVDEEAKRFANIANAVASETGSLKIGFNLGNHEPAYFTQLLQKYVSDAVEVYDLTHTKGYVTVKQHNGNELTLAALTNSVHIPRYLSDGFMPDAISDLYSHMNYEGYPRELLLQGEVPESTIEELKSHLINDNDYMRIKDKSEHKSLDVLLSHAQIGKPVGGEHLQDVPYLTSAAALSLEAQLTVEGHIHGKYDGKNSFGRAMIRPAGEEAALIRKNSDGTLFKEWVVVGDGTYHGGHHNPISYDPNYLTARVDELLAEVAKQQFAIDSEYHPEYVTA